MTSEGESEPPRSSDQRSQRQRDAREEKEPVAQRRPSRDSTGHPRVPAILLMVAVSLLLVGISIAGAM